MKYFIDTNVFLDLVVREGGTRYKESRVFLDKVKSGEVVAITSNLVLAEVGWVLGSFYKTEENEVSRAITLIISIVGLKFVEKVVWADALSLFCRKKVKLVDCLIASMPKISEGKWAVVSYDKDFDKLGVKRMEPGDVVLE